jgi:FecR protein
MSNQFGTYCLKFILAALAVVLFSGTTANAQDVVWRVSKASGDVVISAAGAQPVALSATASLNPGDVIRTGANGRVLLARGAETMLIMANSVVGLPKEQKDGLSTTILQQAGMILLEVEKRNVKHFQVETPYLAAVVKGTQFRVTVDKDDSRVDVLRGQVEVIDFKTGQYTQVYPDQSARVSAEGTAGLSLSGTGLFSPIQQGTPRKSSVTPAQAPTPMPQQRTAAAESAPNGQSLWAPVKRSEPDTTRYSAHATEGGWGERLVARVRGLVGLDRHGNQAGYSAFDFALPVVAGLMVALGVAIGRRRKDPHDRRDDK